MNVRNCDALHIFPVHFGPSLAFFDCLDAPLLDEVVAPVMLINLDQTVLIKPDYSPLVP